ncbi:hypothetical protein AB0M86_18260 [Streptomyces sp. NPDC051639]|uniref:hypothetical protein n=1 Tax=Streptomyces sp. NPDC051639 TaxID=3155671 RepID=UPI00343E7739
MIPTAAPPVAGAALRLLRTAAGRRALQAAVLVGGVFALGFLCGEQAHAADGRTPTAPPTSVASVVERVAQPMRAATTGPPAGQPAGNSTERKPRPRPRPQPNQKRKSQPELFQRLESLQKSQPEPEFFQQPESLQESRKPQKSQPNPESLLKPRKPQEARQPRQKHLAARTEVARMSWSADRAGSLVTETVGSVVRPVADTVVRSVGDPAETLTGKLVAFLPGTLPGLSVPPAPPVRPAVPRVPAVPSLPSPSSRPGALTSPDHPRRAGAVGAPVPDPVAPDAAGREPGSAAVLTYGTAGLGVDGRADATHRAHGRYGQHGRHGRHRNRGPVAGPAPARQAPAGDSSGAPGDRPAVDGGGAWHGDAYAVAPDHRAPLLLVSVPSEAVTAAGTRDRYRDIPLFPG